MDNYTSIIKLNPDIYGFINIAAMVGANNSKIAYRVKRTMEYKASFSAFRDRMFAGLMSVYAKMFELLNSKGSLNNGSLKNYYAIAIETGNDIPRRILSFDMYILQADNFQDLIAKAEFKNLPKIAEKETRAAIFALGYQYDQDMSDIDITNTVFHLKVFKDDINPIKVYKLDNEDDFTYDTDNEKFNSFIDAVFEDTDKNIYYSGLTKEYYKHDHESHDNTESNSAVNNSESSEIKQDKAVSAKMVKNKTDRNIQEIETINIDEILKPSTKGTIIEESSH